MPHIELEPNVKLFYRDDDCTDAWRPGETVFMMHGYGEHSEAWNAWMPHFVRKFRVVRPDMRGFGRSTPMPLDYRYSADGIIADYVRLLDRLGIEKVHVAGAKIGGTLALHFAILHPKRVLSVIAPASRVKGRPSPGGGVMSLDEVAADDVLGWARATQRWRLGEDASPELLEGWSQLMSINALSSLKAFANSFEGIDLTADLPKIVAPTLVIVNDGGPLSSVDEVRAWQTTIPHSELLVLKGGSLHVAATNPDECARAAVDVIERTRVPGRA